FSEEKKEGSTYLYTDAICRLHAYYFGDGCEATRATWKHLEAAGFSDLQLRHIQAPLFFMIKPHIVGYAANLFFMLKPHMVGYSVK
uniref:Uncharacterized protein n=1 Tax=Sinocyclocheilus grahami TaxID=75366 RepID=A0A672P0I7_SINGR